MSALSPWEAGWFDFDVLLIRQQLLTLSEKYLVEDAEGHPRFFVVRPPLLGRRTALSLLVGVINLLLLFGAIGLLAAGHVIAGFVMVIAGRFLLGIAATLLSPYRDIHVYTDPSQAWPLLHITQENKIGFTLRYGVYSATGEYVGRLQRDTLRSILRRDWTALGGDGSVAFLVREDSWARSFLRRLVGPLYGALRLNFDYQYPDGTTFGAYDRQLTLTDQYRLDVSGDRARHVDRRLVLSSSILLDTAERR